MTVKTESKKPNPEAQIRSYLSRFEPKNQKLFRSLRTAIRKRFPTANELAYDYASHVVISYSATEQAIDAFLAIAARDDGVRLYLIGASKLPDPKKLLQGSGGLARFLYLETPSKLAHPNVKALIGAAVDQAKVPLPSKGGGGLFLRGSAAKKSPRGKTKK
jgi:hypothetical protein